MPSEASKLLLDELLTPLPLHSADVLALKKSAKALVSTRTGKALAAPLPQRTQDQLDREAAYEQTKQEVDKWDDTTRQIKEVRLRGLWFRCRLADVAGLAPFLPPPSEDRRQSVESRAYS